MKMSAIKVGLSLLIGLSALTAAGAASATWSPTYSRRGPAYPISLANEFGGVRSGQFWVGAVGPFNSYKTSEPNSVQRLKITLLCSDWSNDGGTLSLVGGIYTKTIVTRTCNAGATANFGSVFMEQ